MSIEIGNRKQQPELTFKMIAKLQEVLELRALIKNGRDAEGYRPNGMTPGILKDCERELGKMLADQYQEEV